MATTGLDTAHHANLGADNLSSPYYQIPKECKAGVVVDEGPNFRVQVQTVPVPEPGPDEVLIRLNATGLCYSDIHFMRGDLDLPPMSAFGVRSPGHEGAGIIVKLGNNVKNWKRCFLRKVFARRAHEAWQLSGERTKQLDLEGCRGDELTVCAAQQYVLSPARYTMPIPDGVDDYTAAPIMCSASTVYRSLVEARLTPGDWVAVSLVYILKPGIFSHASGPDSFLEAEAA
ncbi:hypothetical protein LTS15_010526 [Exophiala xenobiotica]|nr:hypothetical protein LTS15_010526 [Exophiala xenobiotica]